MPIHRKFRSVQIFPASRSQFRKTQTKKSLTDSTTV